METKTNERRLYNRPVERCRLAGVSDKIAAIKVGFIVVMREAGVSDEIKAIKAGLIFARRALSLCVDPVTKQKTICEPAWPSGKTLGTTGLRFDPLPLV